MADSATIAREIYYYNVSYTTVESEKGMAGDFRKMYKEQYRSVISCLFGKWNGAVKSKNVWLLYIVTLLHRYHSSKTVTTEVNVTTDWRYTRKLRSKTSQKNTQDTLHEKLFVRKLSVQQAEEDCPIGRKGWMPRSSIPYNKRNYKTTSQCCLNGIRRSFFVVLWPSMKYGSNGQSEVEKVHFTSSGEGEDCPIGRRGVVTVFWDSRDVIHIGCIFWDFYIFCKKLSF